MALLEVVPSLDDVYGRLGGRSRAEVYATSARRDDHRTATFEQARARITAAERATVLLFGTGWGLARQLLDDADVLVEPIAGAHRDGYNHLSVRAACAIVLDRLLRVD